MRRELVPWSIRRAEIYLCPRLRVRLVSLKPQLDMSQFPELHAGRPIKNEMAIRAEPLEIRDLGPQTDTSVTPQGQGRILIA